ncbi:MAG: glycosyl transferase, partial [Lachnospiraceae bacterium]|nr:glycosyl transferase [Lachnospiraceae bacterium]
MKFGYFDDARKEYVITTPQTPLPWINYLGSSDFFSLISNTCGGYSFFKDAKLLRITRYRYNDLPNDKNGKYYYIKDEDVVWNPGWKPVQADLDSYECRHGIGYSRFLSSKNEVSAELLAFVPVNASCEINSLTLENTSDKVKTLKLFSYVEFCLWNAVDDMTNYQRNLSIGEVEVDSTSETPPRAVIYHKTEYRERRNHYAYFSVNAPAASFDTSRDSFIGAYRDASNPAAVENGICGNSIASGWYPIAAHQIDVTLLPGERKNFIFVLGYAELPKEKKWESPGIINKAPAKELLAHFDTEEKVDAAFTALNTYWEELLAKYHVESQNEKVNRMVNIWNQYQCMVTFN